VTPVVPTLPVSWNPLRMKTAESKSPPIFGPSRRVGPVICLLLFLLALAKGAALISISVEQGLSVLFILIAATWVLREPEKLVRLCEMYVWLAFILSLNHLQILAEELAGWLRLEVFDVFKVIAVTHVLIVIVATWVLGAWGRRDENGNWSSAHFAAGLFIVGSVVFWIGARTFPGMSLDKVQANPEGHVWTAINFMLATAITLGALGLFALALREAGDRYFSVLGLFAFMFGAVFWFLHLAFRLTVMVQAAEEWSRTSTTPAWYEPWRAWAAILFGIYSVLAYVGLAAYGGALLKIGWVAKWAAWTCVVAGLIAAPLGGLPLFIHVPLWLVGILLLRR
jgi:hypothetical protein